MRYGTEYGFYELNPFPGCNQIVVSNHSWIGHKHRGKGIGTHEHQSRLEEIQRLGYDYAICTCKLENAPQQRILEKHGWKLLDSFENRETENKVLIYGKKM